MSERAHALSAPPGQMRLFTPEEANALVPQLRPLLVALRETYHEYQFARGQWEDLESFGEGEGEEAAAWREKADALGRRVLEHLERVRALGADVKDPVLGLADFPTRRNDGTVVLLCYRDDEDRIGHWHTLEAGFGGRQTLDQL